MAAPAKTVHSFKPADEHDSARVQSQPGDRHVIRHDFDDRRRMNVSEKLAEGRGFWRGAFVGLSIGAAGGIVASGGIANMWTPQILHVVENSALISQALAGADAGHSVRNVHPEAGDSSEPYAPPSGPAGASGAR